MTLGNGGGAYEPAVADGPAEDAPSVAFGADLEWENLCRVEERYCEPCCAEYGRKYKYEASRSST